MALQRWATHLDYDAHGVDNPNCTVNPAFCNWSIAYMYYCDGTSWTGDLDEPVSAHFRRVIVCTRYTILCVAVCWMCDMNPCAYFLTVVNMH